MNKILSPACLPTQEIEAIMKNAAKLMLEADSARLNVQHKSGSANFVTEFDVKVQRYLQEHFSLNLIGYHQLYIL